MSAECLTFAIDMPEFDNPQRPRPPRVVSDPSAHVPPQDIEVEQAVLGALMLEKDAYSEVSEILTPDSFYDPRHRKIFSAISALGLAERPIDMLTVKDQLAADGELAAVGGPVYLVDLTSHVYSGANVEYHARIIAQKFLARRLIEFANSVQQKAYDEANDVDDLMQEAEGMLFEISRTQLKREVTQIDPVISQAMAQIEAAANRDSGLSGLPSGFDELDKFTSGWQNSDLIIVAARPAMGKTAFVLSMAKKMAIDNSIPVGFFSLEMSNLQLVNRLISNVCELDNSKIKSGDLGDYGWDTLNTRVRSMYSTPLYVDETPGLSITELRTKARRLVREHGVKIIMIDYLQLMTASGLKFGSREQEVSTISRSLKGLAKELNIPIVALAQLSRNSESRDDKRPMLSDLRESGAIEQDADIVCFIHRPEYYYKSGEDASGADIRGLAEFIIGKHRSGQVGTVKMRFVPRFVRFENWTEARDVVQTAISGSRMNDEADAAPSFGTAAPEPMPDIMPGPDDSDIPF